MDREEVAHELRTPLTTIKGVLALLTAGRLAEFAPDDAADLLDRACQQVTKLEHVVEQIEAQFTIVDPESAIVLYQEPIEQDRPLNVIKGPSHTLPGQRI